MYLLPFNSKSCATWPKLLDQVASLNRRHTSCYCNWSCPILLAICVILSISQKWSHYSICCLSIYLFFRLLCRCSLLSTYRLGRLYLRRVLQASIWMLGPHFISVQFNLHTPSKHTHTPIFTHTFGQLLLLAIAIAVASRKSSQPLPKIPTAAPKIYQQCIFTLSLSSPSSS